MRTLLLFVLLLLSLTANAQLGHFISDRYETITSVGGFTDTDRYYTTTGPDYNLTAFSYFVVVLPTKNETTSNIQFLFGKSDWNHANSGWGFRSFQGEYNQYIDREVCDESAIEKASQGIGVGYAEPGKIMVIHCTVVNNVIYMYRNGYVTGNNGTSGPGITKTTNSGFIPQFGIGFGGYAGAQSAVKSFEGRIIAAGICSSTGLSAAQVKAHYDALLANPNAAPAGATNHWRATDAGATWTDYIGGIVATKVGNPTVQTDARTFFPSYDETEQWGDTGPVYSALSNITGMMDYMLFGDSRSASIGSIKYWWMQLKDAMGMNALRSVGHFPTPADYNYEKVGPIKYNDLNNGMPGRSTRECIDGNATFGPATAELNAYDPDIVIVWFGRNSGNNATAVEEDIKELVQVIHTTKPNARILMVGEVTGIREGVVSSITGLSMAAKLRCYNVFLRKQLPLWRIQGIEISIIKIDDAIPWDVEADWGLAPGFPVNDLVHPAAIENGLDDSPGFVEQGINKVGKKTWPAMRFICGYN